MEPMSKADQLEGEILQGRYAVLKIQSQHGDWVRCLVHDMQDHERREAMIQLGGDGEPELELLSDDETPPPVSVPEPPPAAAQPTTPVPPPPEPAPAATRPTTPNPPPPPVPPARETDPTPERSKKPGRLEAAWFATGADADEVDEEDRPVEDGDVLIAPSKVEQKAVDLTTGTYRRYALDGSSKLTAIPVLAQAAPSPGEPAVPAAPIASGNRRLLLVVALIVGGVGLLTLLFALLR